MKNCYFSLQVFALSLKTFMDALNLNAIIPLLFTPFLIDFYTYTLSLSLTKSFAPLHPSPHLHTLSPFLPPSLLPFLLPPSYPSSSLPPSLHLTFPPSYPSSRTPSLLPSYPPSLPPSLSLTLPPSFSLTFPPSYPPSLSPSYTRADSVSTTGTCTVTLKWLGLPRCVTVLNGLLLVS